MSVPYREAQPSASPAAEPVLPEARGIAWEERSSWLDLKACWRTSRNILLHPSAAFSAVNYEAGIRSSLVFVIVFGSLGQIFGLYWLTLTGIQHGTMQASALGNTVRFTVAASLTPLFLVISLFLGAGLLHLFLRILSGTNRSLGTTFQVVAYVSGATSLLNIIPLNLIPLVGGFIVPLWALVLNCIALATAHQTPRIKTLLALLLPLILIVGIVVLVLMLVAALGLFELLQTMRQSF